MDMRATGIFCGVLLLTALSQAQPVMETGFSVSQSATAANLDGDPQLEVVVSSQDGHLYVFNHDGTVMAGWPQYMGPALWPDPYANICSSPAVHDLNGDGILEIIVGNFDGWMYVFEPDGSDFPGWPFQSGFMIFSTPALGDIDGDGYMEIVWGDNSGGIYAANHDGTVCPGFPYPTPYVVRSSPAVGDLDGDGGDEIVITADNSQYHLYALEGNGTNMPGFPQLFANAIGSNSSPTLADVDADGDLEIVVGDRSGYLHVMHHTGVYLPGWPLDAGYSLQSCPTVVNLDLDPSLEIIVGMNDSQVRIYKLDGSQMAGWPQITAYTVISSASVGCIDGDDEYEIVVGCNTGDVYGWNLDGTPAAGFPLTQPTYTVYSSPLLADLDLDNHLEMVLGCNDTWVYCWDMGAGTYRPDQLPWPEFRRDARNTSTVPWPPGPALATVSLVPVGAPLVIPAGGGSFDYNCTLVNLSDSTCACDAWVMVRLPNGTWFGPALGPLSLILPGGGAVTRLRTQAVPATAPVGQYWYEARVGDYPGVVWDTSGFGFTKAGAGDGRLEAGENWACTGDPFPGELGGRSVASIPETFALSVSPNPFNPSTAVGYRLPAPGLASLRVYDTAGREVATLVDGWRDSGVHEVTFDGSGLASGIYVVRLEAAGRAQARRIVLLK